MTLFASDVVWSWPEVDLVVDLDDLVLREWRKRGDSHKFLAYDEDDWESSGRKATPRWLIKTGPDAVAERLTYLVSRTLDLPCQHVFWGAHDDSVVAAIRYVPGARAVPKIRRSSDGRPYVLVNSRHVRIRNLEDIAGHRALLLLFSDLDGGETMIDPSTGIIFRIDGAAGHDWATNA